jgi:hypothetical protein
MPKIQFNPQKHANAIKYQQKFLNFGIDAATRVIYYRRIAARFCTSFITGEERAFRLRILNDRIGQK